MTTRDHLHIPRRRQRLFPPPKPVLLGLLGVAVVLAAMWLALSAAVGFGGDDCAAQKNPAASARCR